MEKKYLLLRNNIETGPFTLEELVRLRLRPSDLVWEEGKSLAWAYPTEIEAIRAALTPPQEAHDKGHRRPHQHPAPKAKRFHRPAPEREVTQVPPPEESLPAYIRRPSDEIERKAEELRRKVLSCDSGPGLHPRMPEGAEPTGAPLPNMADDIDFVYHRRRGAVTASQVLVAGMIGAMLVVGWYGRPLLNAKKDTVNSVATKLESTEENQAAAPKETPPAPQAVSLPADSSMITDSTLLAAQTQPVKPRPTGLPKEDAKVAAALPAAPDSGLAGGKADNATGEETTPVKQPEVVAVAPTEKKEPEATAPKETVEEEPAEKKKGLGQAIKNIFRGKKKKDREQGGDDTLQAEGKDAAENE